MANTNDVPKHSDKYDLRKADSVLKSRKDKLIIEITAITILNSDIENLVKYFY